MNSLCMFSSICSSGLLTNMLRLEVWANCSLYIQTALLTASSSSLIALFFICITLDGALIRPLTIFEHVSISCLYFWTDCRTVVLLQSSLAPMILNPGAAWWRRAEMEEERDERADQIRLECWYLFFTHCKIR